jgi:hypothetical protein
MTRRINAATRRAIEMLAADSKDPEAARKKAEGYVRDDACYCCGLHSLCDDDCGITRCYICCGRGHGDEALT